VNGVVVPNSWHWLVLPVLPVPVRVAVGAWSAGVRAEQFLVGVLEIRVDVDAGRDVQPLHHNGAVELCRSAGRRTSILVSYGACSAGVTDHRPSLPQTPFWAYPVAVPPKKYSCSV
jgi:hypothetical protein